MYEWIVAGTLVLTSLAAVAALFFTSQSLRATNSQLRISEQGQITDRYNAAITNLGSRSIDIRLGGIYALQRLMRDSPRDQPTVIAVLCAFVRDRNMPASRLATDIQAALTVVDARNTANDGATTVVDLDRAELAGGQLDHGNLIRAYLAFADLTDANLAGAYLTGANLNYAKLSGAGLTKAHLIRAELHDANLTHAALDDAKLSDVELYNSNLSHAYLAGSDLTRADLSFANLTGADFSRANLTRADLQHAKLTDDAWLIEELTRTSPTRTSPTRSSTARTSPMRTSLVHSGQRMRQFLKAGCETPTRAA